jgi:hypothetical protein
MKVYLSLLVVFLLFVPSAALPEIERISRVCGNGLCPTWWPKLESVKGWHHEEGASLATDANIQVPDGLTFSGAETVIYARAFYKPRIPEVTSLAALIKSDRDEFLKADSSIEIIRLPPLKTKDGKVLETYKFFPRIKGNWEEVSYGEEGEFYITFTISSRSRVGFMTSLPVYEQYIAQYRE